jgi:hypothetical protein
MRIDGMNIPYAARVFAMDVRSLVALDNPVMPDSFRKRSDEVNNAAT